MQDIRPGEIQTDQPLSRDAELTFIGHVETPWTKRADCPRQGSLDGPECVVVVDPPWDRALEGIEQHRNLEIYTWLHESRRDLLIQVPRHGDGPCGTFALRSPVRPNPIGASRVRLVRRDGSRLVVRGLDCLDGTPLIDIKPERCPVGQ